MGGEGKEGEREGRGRKVRGRGGEGRGGGGEGRGGEVAEESPQIAPQPWPSSTRADGANACTITRVKSK
jgi:hypothetical protein